MRTQTRPGATPDAQRRSGFCCSSHSILSRLQLCYSDAELGGVVRVDSSFGVIGERREFFGLGQLGNGDLGLAFHLIHPLLDYLDAAVAASRQTRQQCKRPENLASAKEIHFFAPFLSAPLALRWAATSSLSN